MNVFTTVAPARLAALLERLGPASADAPVPAGALTAGELRWLLVRSTVPSGVPQHELRGVAHPDEPTDPPATVLRAFPVCASLTSPEPQPDTLGLGCSCGWRGPTVPFPSGAAYFTQHTRAGEPPVVFVPLALYHAWRREWARHVAVAAAPARTSSGQD